MTFPLVTLTQFEAYGTQIRVGYAYVRMFATVKLDCCTQSSLVPMGVYIEYFLRSQLQEIQARDICIVFLGLGA